MYLSSSASTQSRVKASISVGVFTGLILSFGWTGFFSAAFAKGKPPLQTPKSLDLNRFQGKWYEIAYTPNPFEKQCVSNTTDEYTVLSADLIKVINRCDTTGKPYVAEGRSKLMDSTGARQQTTFLKLLGQWVYLPLGDYWVTALATNYQYFIVAQPSRRYGWILARTPSLPKPTLKQLADTLKIQGYEPCQWVTTPQNGGLQHKQSLCAVSQ